VLALLLLALACLTTPVAGTPPLPLTSAGGFSWLSDIVVPLVAALIGGGIGVWGGKQLESARIRRERASIRQALSVEIEANLSLLRTLLEELHNPRGRMVRRPASPEVAPLLRLSEHPLPPFRRTVWGDQLPGAVDALTIDEIERVAAIYHDFGQLETLHNSIGSPWQTIADDKSLNFNEQDKATWQRFQQTAEALLAGENPL
jgi:hypothetical protein